MLGIGEPSPTTDKTPSLAGGVLLLRPTKMACRIHTSRPPARSGARSGAGGAAGGRRGRAKALRQSKSALFRPCSESPVTTCRARETVPARPARVAASTNRLAPLPRGGAIVEDAWAAPELHSAPAPAPENSRQAARRGRPPGTAQQRPLPARRTPFPSQSIAPRPRRGPGSRADGGGRGRAGQTHGRRERRAR
jgi:hypothetical protein